MQKQIALADKQNQTSTHQHRTANPAGGISDGHFHTLTAAKTAVACELAARDDDKRIKKTANSWIKYAENEEVRVQNLALRRKFIEESQAKAKAKNS